MKRSKVLTLAAFVVALATACSEKVPQAKNEMPVVNDANCKPEYIAKVEEKAMRAQFADACARRGGFQPSSGRTW
ncbi:MAG: entry exclusion lipoprotein TrbK [Gammaproteobacteria bacterium]